jgi:hypothetical protein
LPDVPEVRNAEEGGIGAEWSAWREGFWRAQFALFWTNDLTAHYRPIRAGIAQRTPKWI